MGAFGEPEVHSSIWQERSSEAPLKLGRLSMLKTAYKEEEELQRWVQVLTRLKPQAVTPQIFPGRMGARREATVSPPAVLICGGPLSVQMSPVDKFNPLPTKSTDLGGGDKGTGMLTRVGISTLYLGTFV